MAIRQPRSRPQAERKPSPTIAAVETPSVEVVPRLWTYEDYCAIPDDGYRYEVIEGELYVAPAPDVAHQRIIVRLLLILAPFVEEHDLGEVLLSPTDVLLSTGTFVQPDLLFVRKDRGEVITERNVRGVPDLVIEVLSPSTAAYDRSKKRDAYAATGVPHYWILSGRARTLEAYELRDGIYLLVERLTDDETFSPSLFPGLSFSLAPLWR